ncbi:thioesterase family protein [Parafrankia sp. FMc2]|uniref:thioesterase family protein n=1 Tax=Parafrankia sp. FMc2 TaxID=3233196 RepID=UPI0034D7073C
MSTSGPTSDSYYVRTGEHRFKPTSHAGGAWHDDEQHFSPLGGLIVHAIDHHTAARPHGEMVLGRISFDILGSPALDECEIRVETVRPGRTIELVEATVLMADRPLVRARAWNLAVLDSSSVAGGGAEQLPHPDTLAPWPLSTVWRGGYIDSVNVRPLTEPRPGRTTAWISSRVDLVAGEAASPLASFVALVDTANGIAVRQPPTAWMFPNLDLTVHLHRQPQGRWAGLDTTVVFGDTGQGLTSTVLHDLAGPVGHARQILTVRPQDPPSP